jgi:AcrR family transcriptional regulator
MVQAMRNTPERSRPKAPQKTRTRLLLDERRAQLLALGIRIFSARSYDEVSIDDLAEAAGVSKGLLYHYFPTKRDFYVAALRRQAKDLLAETETPRDAPPEERVQQGLDAYLAFVERYGQAYVALMRGGIGSDPEVARILDRTRTAIVNRILADVPEEAVTPLLRTALRGWIGFVEAAAIDWLSRREVPRAELAALLGGVLLHVDGTSAARRRGPRLGPAIPSSYLLVAPAAPPAKGRMVLRSSSVKRSWRPRK